MGKRAPFIFSEIALLAVGAAMDRYVEEISPMFWTVIAALCIFVAFRTWPDPAEDSISVAEKIELLKVRQKFIMEFWDRFSEGIMIFIVVLILLFFAYGMGQFFANFEPRVPSDTPSIERSAEQL